jgi:hypothetical protein
MRYGISFKRLRSLKETLAPSLARTSKLEEQRKVTSNHSVEKDRAADCVAKV